MQKQSPRRPNSILASKLLLFLKQIEWSDRCTVKIKLIALNMWFEHEVKDATETVLEFQKM